MSNWRILYWFIVGACFGFGVISILSIGIIFLAAGLLLLIFGALRLGPRRMWAAIVGFGALPAAILLWDVTSQPWACEPANHTVYSPIVPPTSTIVTSALAVFCASSIRRITSSGTSGTTSTFLPWYSKLRSRRIIS